MKDNAFKAIEPAIDGNRKLRIPQREAYDALADFASQQPGIEREIGVVLPVGCGKSGCIAVAPFAFRSRRTLVVAPNVKITQQLVGDFDPANPEMFYSKCEVLDVNQSFPEPVEIRGRTTNRADLEEADVVVTNIQQLQGRENRWLQDVPDDFFDLILFDEGHHNVAASWEALRAKFVDAKIVNFSATPHRADGQLMSGRIVYSFPVARAIQDGYVKNLKAVVLNPSTLRYVRREDQQEVEVSLDEVRRLGEDDAGFRRSIVTSTETLNTIVDASIRQMQKLRQSAGDPHLKIIASALNYHHCLQVVEAYRARGLKADYVHSRADSRANERVLSSLDANQIDVIVQVRKLGEGFNHPRLAVAAVFSVFSNLSPFVQFVGRIMRTIDPNGANASVNQGVVVFHAGANIARRWEDFQEYSEADQQFFDQLLPLEGLDFSSADELELENIVEALSPRSSLQINQQSHIELEEIPLILKDEDAVRALETLKGYGYTVDQVRRGFEALQPVPTTRVRQRQARRSSLDTRVKLEVGRILGENGVNPEGHELDIRHVGRTNFVVLKSAIDREINSTVGHGAADRHNLSQEDLDQIDQQFTIILNRAIDEVFSARN